ncbi:hypothetical protein [Candidatus Chloroploca sp. Khr17]|uniref:hypothetical protein n=1 Tax=Candidatus Chloroploca sp. Khr17 TaxID=2496869 RepID=UPI00101C6BAC|nr:hypothetical protein [Candidatus Chloroploca sp. Khr17]
MSGEDDAGLTPDTWNLTPTQVSGEDDAGLTPDPWNLTPTQVSGVRFQVSGEDDAGLTPDPWNLTPTQVSGKDDAGLTPDTWNLTPTLRRMLARGLGLRELPEAIKSYEDALALILTPDTWNLTPAFPYDLAFPEVFYAQVSGVRFQVSGADEPGAELTPDTRPLTPGLTPDTRSLTPELPRHGFDVVVGNPPWDRMLPADKEFFAAYEFTVLDAPTKREREAIERRIMSNPQAAAAHAEYIEEFRGVERVLDRLYTYQVVEIDGEKTIGKQDAFRAFMERNAQVLGPTGLTGVVVPSAFHANEGATGIRRLYFEQMATRCCYSFENRNKLFEIDSRFKFAPVVAARQGPTTEFPCAFYLHDDAWLFEQQRQAPLRYSLDFVRRTGGEYLSLLELRSPADAEVARICFANGVPFGQVCEQLGIRLGRELHMTDDAWRFTPTSQVLPNGVDPRDPEVAAALREQGYLVLHEGKTFHQYTDMWEARPQYLLHTQKIGRATWLQSVVFWRLALRKVASSTNERTFVTALLPAGVLTGDSTFVDQESSNHSTAYSLLLLSICCSFSYDFVARQMVSANVNLFIANRLPVPRALLTPETRHLTPARFLAHSALRLTCNHAGYAALWREQVGEAWREERAPFDWPVLKDDDARWAVRAAIDAVVAEAYGLSREQYAHVLSTFSHKSYPQAPERCLAAFDELKALGLEAFTKQHDPYWDIPLNENLPEPVIELPLPEGSGVRGQGSGAEDQGSGVRGQGSGVQGGRRGRKASVEEPTPLYAEPQLALDLGEESPPAQQVIDFAAAAERVSPRPMRKAAEVRQGYRADEAERYERVKALLAERASLSSGEVQGSLEVDVATARALLRRLVDEGLARVEGEKRGTRYVGVTQAD